MYNKQVRIAPGVCVVYTMTATVIVPQQDRTCTQWITFTGDNEPILNTAPNIANDGCDNFLKRLQRSKLYSNSDPSLPGNSQFCFEAVVDKRYNRWKRRRRKKKESESQQSSAMQASDSSDENEGSPSGRNMAIESIIDRMYDKINGSPPQTPGGTRDTPRVRNRRRRTNNDSDGDWKVDSDAVSYDASSEWTSSDKDGGMLSSSSCACNGTGNPTRKTPEEPDSILYSDDQCSWPCLEQYKQEIMRRLSLVPHDKFDETAQNDWLPDISFRNIASGIQDGGPPEYDGSTGSQTPVEQKPVIRPREKTHPPVPAPSTPSTPGTSASRAMPESPQTFASTPMWIRSEKSNMNIRPRGDKISTPVPPPSSPEPSAPRATPERPQAIVSNSMWLHSEKPIRKPLDDKPKLLSRTSASSWSEMGLNPSPAKRVGLVAVGENNSGTSSYKEKLQPIRHNDIMVSSTAKLTKKPKLTLPGKNISINLPTIAKNAKLQTMPKLDRTLTNKTSKVAKRPDPQKEPAVRPKTEPQTTSSRRKSDPVYQAAAETDRFFKDYYLRSLYGRKGRINSHAASSKTGAKLQKTITVDNLDLGSQRGGRKKNEEEGVSNMSFTRSFTFSMFDLPEMYKLYNTRIERKANGEAVTESD